MIKQIDIPSSIERERLTYKISIELIAKAILDNSIWVFFIGATCWALLDNQSIPFAMIAVTLLTWIISGLYYANKLLKVNGITKSKNRELVIELLKSKFSNFTIDDSGQNIVRFKNPWTFYSWEREIIVIFNENDFYINYSTFGRSSKSPFHAVSNYMMMKRLMNKIPTAYE